MRLREEGAHASRRASDTGNHAVSKPSWFTRLRTRKLSLQRDRALGELAEARAALARRESFTDALLEVVDIGIVSCDADGVFVVSNRAQREIFGLRTGLQGLEPGHLPAVIDVFNLEGDPLTVDEYPLMRTLRGEDISPVDVLVGPATGPRREVVVRASRITGPNGELMGAVAALSDMTLERTALRALDEERRNLHEAQLLGQLGGFQYDVATETWEFSDQLGILWGVAPGTLTGEEFRRAIYDRLIVEQYRELAWDTWKRDSLIAGHHSDQFRIRRANDDAERVIQLRFDVELGPDARPVRVRGTHLDITDLAMAQRATQRANAFADAILTASPDDTIVTDVATGALVYASPGRHVLGLTGADLESLGPDAVTDRVHPDDRERLSAMRVATSALGDGQWLQERFRARHADDRWLWLNERATPFRRDASGEVVEILAVVRDVTDLVQAEGLLTHAARHDPLTGLPNRALFAEILDAALARSAGDGREVAVLYCDLDGFKRVNDTSGHSAGDEVLQETARRMQGVLRAGDTVARVGGDEFVVVIEPWNRDDFDDGQAGPHGHEPARELAVGVAERMIDALSGPIRVRGVDHVVTASIGITYATVAAAAGPEVVTVDKILRQADAAMYRAKDRGKNRYELYEQLPDATRMS